MMHLRAGGGPVNPDSVLADLMGERPGECTDCGWLTGHYCVRCGLLVCWACYNEEHFCDE